MHSADNGVDRALASAISDAVDANVDRLVSLTQSLIACRSDSQSQHNPEFEREAERCQDIVASWLDDLGFTIERWQQPPRYPVVAGRLAGSGKGPSLALNGHVDVVPGGDRSAWRYDPWAGDVTDGKLWGRGAADMKGGVACALMAAWALREARVQLAGDLWLHVDADEEVVGQSLRELLKRMPSVDAALVAEPTDLAVLPVEGGLVHVRIEVSGRESHAGNRYRSIHAGGHGATAGINAIEKAMRVAQALQDLERQWGNLRHHPLLPPGFNSIMPGMIAGGPGGGEDGQLRTISNPGTSPDYCSLEYNIWYLPGQTLKEIQEEVEGYVADVSRLDPWLRDHPPRFSWKLRNIYFPPAETPLDHPFVNAISQSMAAANVPVRIEAFQAASELAWYAERGIPGVIFGPGRIAQAHGPDEYVEVEQLVTACKVMALTATAWCGGR